MDEQLFRIPSFGCWLPKGFKQADDQNNNMQVLKLLKTMYGCKLWGRVQNQNLHKTC